MLAHAISLRCNNSPAIPAASASEPHGQYMSTTPLLPDIQTSFLRGVCVFRPSATPHTHHYSQVSTKGQPAWAQAQGNRIRAEDVNSNSGSNTLRGSRALTAVK